ncbi:hypothetical protein LVD15_23375 [Fulvivirga maritima]|uniref:hypothetical protein n=1 Tax=Fulvivirga maritima TaxID=2904247 RepID=UPI001F188B51|nr:hypothetical protein [Fulvivirga maritima]UII26209.1 hypothetical protein LVD15_23375 [Fulvivirga maritima]
MWDSKKKKVFYKFFQRIFTQKLSNNFNQFEIYADKIGDAHFQSSLSDHIYKNSIQRDLFNPDRLYKLADDQSEEPLIQFADFIAGCLGKIYSTSHYDERSSSIFEKLSSRIFLEFFPYAKENYLGKEIDENDEENAAVTEIAIEVALNFLETSNGDVKEEDKEIIRFLLMIFRSNKNKVVSTNDLLTIAKRINPNYSEQQLRHRIGFLRDQGILIVSMEGEYGYKLPNKKSDLVRYYNRLLRSIVPMIKRIKNSNEIIKLKTLNGIDIIDSVDGYEMLRQFIDITNSNKKL